MTVPRLHATSGAGMQQFGRAKLTRTTLALLLGLRVYAIVAVCIALYSFFRAIH